MMLSSRATVKIFAIQSLVALAVAVGQTKVVVGVPGHAASSSAKVDGASAKKGAHCNPRGDGAWERGAHLLVDAAGTSHRAIVASNRAERA